MGRPADLKTLAEYQVFKVLEEDDRWKDADNAELFWQLHWDDNNLLTKLATRIFHTLANEIPSERVFSAMKLLHSIVRNRLSEERVDKLLFIQINLRTLRRQPKARKPPSRESDGSDTEDAQDCSPYQLVPLIVQRLSGLSECWGHSCRARAGYIARNAAIGIAQFRRKIDIPLGMAQGAWNAHFP
jgi:hAT family C-terminal dimerisation region